MNALKVGGLTPLTTIDYPGELAAVVFCPGCPWRCRYCHNSGLLSRREQSAIRWPELIAFLQRRRGLLDAVVFSGGEPTLQSGLAEAMAEVRNLGFKIGLHSAGCYPDRLAAVLRQTDWVGLDIKALPEDYERLTGVPESGAAAWESLELLVASNVEHEIRITVHDALMPPARLRRLVGRLLDKGVRTLALQQCQWRRMLDKTLGPAGGSWRMPDVPDAGRLVFRS